MLQSAYQAHGFEKHEAAGGSAVGDGNLRSSASLFAEELVWSDVFHFGSFGMALLFQSV